LTWWGGVGRLGVGDGLVTAENLAIGSDIVRMLWRDFWLAGRGLGKSPGFTAVAVLTLALGMGANLALFGILNEMLLRPKPVSRPDELRAVVMVNEGGQRLHLSVYRPY